MKLGRPVYHVEIPAFDEPEFSHPPQELLKISNDNIRFAVPQPSNKRPLFCLRLYRKRPCSRNGTNKADKFPSCHGIYSPSREPPSCKSNTNIDQQPWLGGKTENWKNNRQRRNQKRNRSSRINGHPKGLVFLKE